MSELRCLAIQMICMGAAANIFSAIFWHIKEGRINRNVSLVGGLYSAVAIIYAITSVVIGVFFAGENSRLVLALLLTHCAVYLPYSWKMAMGIQVRD